MPEIREFMKQFYILDDWVRQFLSVGEEEALLIDTGVEESHVAEAVRQITSLPVRVVLTHGDHDHAGGLGAFGSCLVHPEDADMLPPEIRWQPLREGDTLECGGYRFEVLHIPGHTPGSIALLDREHRILVSGDAVSSTPVFIFGRMRNLEAFQVSLCRLKARQDEFDLIYPSHGSFPIDKEQIDNELRCAQRLQRGELNPMEPPFPMPAKMYRSDDAGFYSDSAFPAP